MYEFWTHACILMWAILGTVAASVALLVLIVFIGHEFFVIMSNAITTNKEENQQ